MSYLRNIITNAVTTDISYQSDVYRALIKQRTTAASTTLTPDPNVEYEEGTTFTIGPNEPIWEEIPIERVEKLTKFVLAAILPAVAAGADAQAELTAGLGHDITITAATYKPVAAIKGAATNFRTTEIISNPEGTPVVNAKVAFESGTNAEAEVEKTITVETAGVKAGLAVVAKSLHTASGLADPGGLVLVTFTQD